MDSKNHPREKNDDATKIETKPVREIVEPATAVKPEVSVAAALEELQACQEEAAAVTDQSGKLLGGVTKNQMYRKVTGFGHDPQAFPVEPNMDKNVARCFEDQTIGEAENVMREAKVDQVPVITRETSLIGKARLETIQKKRKPTADH